MKFMTHASKKLSPSMIFLLDTQVYSLARRLIGWTGGSWSDAEVNGVPFMYPNIDGPVTITNEYNGHSKTTDAKTAGAIICVYALNLLLNDLYHKTGENPTTLAFNDLWMELHDTICATEDSGIDMRAYYSILD